MKPEIELRRPTGIDLHDALMMTAITGYDAGVGLRGAT